MLVTDVSIDYSQPSISSLHASPMSCNFRNHESNYHLLRTESASSTSLSSLHINSFNPMTPIRKALLTPLYRRWNWSTVVSPSPNYSSVTRAPLLNGWAGILAQAACLQRPRWFPNLHTVKLHSSSSDLLVLQPNHAIHQRQKPGSHSSLSLLLCALPAFTPSRKAVDFVFT